MKSFRHSTLPFVSPVQSVTGAESCLFLDEYITSWMKTLALTALQGLTSGLLLISVRPC